MDIYKMEVNGKAGNEEKYREVSVNSIKVGVVLLNITKIKIFSFIRLMWD